MNFISNDLSPWEIDSHPVLREISRLLFNQNVYYLAYVGPVVDFIQSRLNPVHTLNPINIHKMWFNWLWHENYIH
jgi:hypothetical protein